MLHHTQHRNQLGCRRSELLAPAATAPAIAAAGPFNPAASVAMKVVKRILDLEFVEISEVTCIADNPQIPGRPPPPVRPAITEWVERFSLMAAILATRFPLKAPEFWAYQATIVRAERNYEGTRWVAYDRQFLREALAHRDLNWSVTDMRLYNEVASYPGLPLLWEKIRERKVW